MINIKLNKKKNQLFKNQKQPNKKQNSFYKLQKMHMYCKNCKKHTDNTFPKKIVLILKNKIKGNQNALLKRLLLIKLKTNMI